MFGAFVKDVAGDAVSELARGMANVTVGEVLRMLTPVAVFGM